MAAVIHFHGKKPNPGPGNAAQRTSSSSKALPVRVFKAQSYYIMQPECRKWAEPGGDTMTSASIFKIQKERRAQSDFRG